MLKKPKISVVGLGFVGLTLATVNANKGFETIGIDIDESKIKNLKKGNPNFFEPNLKKFLRKSLQKNYLTLTKNLENIIQTDITFLTVGTPTHPDGKIDLSQLKKVVSKLSKLLEKKKSKHIVVIKSTVIPTTTWKFISPKFKNKNIGIIVNPEFLREGNAIKDLLEPHLIVIGESNNKHGDILENYYRVFYKKLPEILRTDYSTAEMIKYTNNAFLATKISFINSIANICQNIPKVDVNKVAYAIGKDSRIGNKFLNAGPGFGGSCLPKDLSALIGFTNQFGKINSLLRAVKEINDSQPTQIIRLLKNMRLFRPKKTVAILGLAFKKNTDDIREAVSIKLVKKLLKNKMNVKVHDPMAMINFRKIFGKKLTYCKTVKSCIMGTDVCIILTEWDEYTKINQNDLKKYMNNANLIDARRILNPEKFSKINFNAIGFGN